MVEKHLINIVYLLRKKAKVRKRRHEGWVKTVNLPPLGGAASLFWSPLCLLQGNRILTIVPGNARLSAEMGSCFCGPSVWPGLYT